MAKLYTEKHPYCWVSSRPHDELDGVMFELRNGKVEMLVSGHCAPMRLDRRKAHLLIQLLEDMIERNELRWKR